MRKRKPREEPKSVTKDMAKPFVDKSKAVSKTPKKCVVYACRVCRGRRRVALPRRERHGKVALPRMSLAQKRQAAANEEARNAARAAKRQKAKQKEKEKAVEAVGLAETAGPEPVEVEKSKGVGRKRNREDKLSRAVSKLNTDRAAGSFEF